MPEQYDLTLESDGESVEPKWQMGPMDEADGDLIIVVRRNRGTSGQACKSCIASRRLADWIYDNDIEGKLLDPDDYHDFHQRHMGFTIHEIQTIMSKANSNKESKPRGCWEPHPQADCLLTNILRNTKDAGDAIMAAVFQQNLTRDDFLSLVGAKSWVNDAIMSELLSLICRIKPDKAPKTRWMDHFEVLKMMNTPPGENFEVGMATMTRPTHAIRLEELDLLIIPILQNNHWSTIIFDMPNKCLVHLDSIMNRKESTRILNHVAWFFEKHMDASSTFQVGWVKRNMKCPQQGNSYDCGVWVLLNTLCFVLDVNPMVMERYREQGYMAILRWYLGCVVLNKGFRGVESIQAWPRGPFPQAFFANEWFRSKLRMEGELR